MTDIRGHWAARGSPRSREAGDHAAVRQPHVSAAGARAARRSRRSRERRALVSRRQPSGAARAARRVAPPIADVAPGASEITRAVATAVASGVLPLLDGTAST